MGRLACLGSPAYRRVMLRVLAVSIWLGALAVLLAGFAPALARIMLHQEFPLLALGTVGTIVLAHKALGISRDRGFGGRKLFGDKPSWTLVVQLLLLVALFVFGLCLPEGRANGEICTKTLNGLSVQLSTTECLALRVRSLQFFAVSWLTFGWFAVVELVSGCCAGSLFKVIK